MQGGQDVPCLHCLHVVVVTADSFSCTDGKGNTITDCMCVCTAARLRQGRDTARLQSEIDALRQTTLAVCRERDSATRLVSAMKVGRASLQDSINTCIREVGGYPQSLIDGEDLRPFVEFILFAYNRVKQQRLLTNVKLEKALRLLRERQAACISCEQGRSYKVRNDGEVLHSSGIICPLNSEEHDLLCID